MRTPGTVARTPHFECGSFDHSDIFPNTSIEIDAAKVQKMYELNRISTYFFFFAYKKAGTSAS